MRRRMTLFILILLLGGAGYYEYTNGWKLPSILASADRTTTGKVKTALGLSKRLSAFDLGVKTEGGVVTLSGQVTSDDLKSLAGEIARDTAGVKDVKNEIAVNPGARPSSESSRVEDLEIKTAILQALAHSAELSGKNIDVKVETQVVTLSGSVETPAQRNGAEQLARSVQGVAGVTNNLAVTNPQAPTEPPLANKPAADPNTELAKRVEFEMYRTGAFDVQTITVRANDGAVTLSGAVRSRAEHLLAERVAQTVDGVKKVNNELKISGAAPAHQ